MILPCAMNAEAEMAKQQYVVKLMGKSDRGLRR
jgi:hypothetical protein